MALKLWAALGLAVAIAAVAMTTDAPPLAEYDPASLGPECHGDFATATQRGRPPTHARCLVNASHPSTTFAVVGSPVQSPLRWVPAGGGGYDGVLRWAEGLSWRLQVLLLPALRLLAAAVPDGMSPDNFRRAFLTHSAVRIFYRQRVTVFAVSRRDHDESAARALSITQFTRTAAGAQGSAAACKGQWVGLIESVEAHPPSPLRCTTSQRHFIETLYGTLWALAWPFGDDAVEPPMDMKAYRDLTAAKEGAPAVDPLPPLGSVPQVEPACVIDLSAAATSQCVHVSCSDAHACMRQHPVVTLVSSSHFDGAVLLLLLSVVLLHVLKPIVTRSAVVQLLLSASLGVLVVAAGICFALFQLLDRSRIGRVGATAIFAVGGTTAVLQGLVDALWFWVYTDVRQSIAAQATIVGCGVASTLLCYRYLGDRLSVTLHYLLIAAQVGCVVAAVDRNREAMLILTVAVAVAAYFVPPVLSGVVAVATYDPEDPQDEFPAEAYHAVDYRQPLCEGPAGTAEHKDRWFTETGKEHTRRELAKLQRELRANHGQYMSRLQAPQDVMHWAGVGYGSDSDH